MKAKDILTVWSAPDNTRLTSKQYSFRLPVHVAAKLAALGEMYPSKSRTQIVADLLSASLSEVEAQFPEVRGPFFTTDPDSGDELYEDIGPARRYRDLANIHYRQLEQELGTENPPELFGPTPVIAVRVAE